MWLSIGLWWRRKARETLKEGEGVSSQRGQGAGHFTAEFCVKAEL
jgi:hypothetical protein